jgi:hypothetical protein
MGKVRRVGYREHSIVNVLDEGACPCMLHRAFPYVVRNIEGKDLQFTKTIEAAKLWINKLQKSRHQKRNRHAGY